VTAIRQQIDLRRANPLLGQLIRFAIAGGIATVVYEAVYLPLVYFVLPRPWWWFANVPAFAVGVTCGFFLHSAWSFRGHGSREPGPVKHVKFVTVQAFGMLLNVAFTWILTGRLHLPGWAPVIPAIFVTPLATFALNRSWVFG